MSEKQNRKPLAVALGTVFTATLAGTTVSDASANPFSMTPLSGGYTILAEGKCGEGKCGEGKCGGAKVEGDDSTAEKGSEGLCGMRRMDLDGDGKVTREEFVQGHDEMFTRLDTNGDGVLDAEERHAHMAKMKAKFTGEEKCPQGKCGEGKCGGNR